MKQVITGLERFAERLEQQLPKPKPITCPQCRGTNFEILNKPVNRTLMLVLGVRFGAGNHVQGVCRDCCKVWAIK